MEMVKGIYRTINLLISNSLTCWYLFFLNTNCYYQIYAMRNGIKKNRESRMSIFNLRRNIHRIEKGLISKKQRSVFAEEYILDTVNWLSQVKDIEKNTFIWGMSILYKYFEVCQHNTNIKTAYSLYKKIDCNLAKSSTGIAPYSAGDRDDAMVSYNDIYLLSLRRRSIRYFLDRKVEYGLIEKAMEIAILSPSACNRQAFKFVFYNNKSVVDKILEIPGGFSGYSAPSVIVILGDYSGYFDERDMNVPIIDASLAAMSFILALETIGLSSVCVNWPAVKIKDRKLRNLIEISEDNFVIMLICIGYADPKGGVPISCKRDISCILSNNRL